MIELNTQTYAFLLDLSAYLSTRLLTTLNNTGHREIGLARILASAAIE